MRCCALEHTPGEARVNAMADGAQLGGMAAGEPTPGLFSSSSGAHDWSSSTHSPAPQFLPFASPGWAQASPSMASPGIAFQPLQGMPQSPSGIPGQQAHAMAEVSPIGEDAAMEDASAELASTPASTRAWPHQPHSQTQLCGTPSCAYPPADSPEGAHLLNQVSTQTSNDSVVGEPRPSERGMEGTDQGSGIAAKELDLVLEPCPEGCACLVCAMAPGDTGHCGPHLHKRKHEGAQEDASQPKRPSLVPEPPLLGPQQALGSTPLLAAVVGAGPARDVLGSTPGAVGQRPAGDLSARLASLVRSAPGASRAGEPAAAQASTPPSLGALGVPNLQGQEQSAWQPQAQQQQQQEILASGQGQGLWHQGPGPQAQKQALRQEQAQGTVSWERQVERAQGKVHNVLSSISGVGADLLVRQSQKIEEMQDEPEEAGQQGWTGQQGAGATDSAIVPYNQAGTGPFQHPSGSPSVDFSVPGNLVLPRDLLSGVPGLTDLTGLEDLPWIAPDLNLDFGALADLDFGALEPAGALLTNGDGAEGEDGRSGSSDRTSGTSEGGSPSPSPARALASLERVRQVANEEGPVEQRLRKRLLALAEAVVTNDEMQTSIFTRLLEADASPDGSPMQRITWYTLKALDMRRKGEGLDSTRGTYQMTAQMSAAALEFTAVLPYVEFWSLGFNCAIIDAVAGRRRVHIVDFGMWQKQWLHAFRHLQASYAASHSASAAYRSQRQVQIRFTAVYFPPESARGTGPMMTVPDLQVELALAAAEAGVELQFNVLRTSMENFDPAMLELGLGGGAQGLRLGGEGEQEEEAMVVNLSTHLETLADASVLRSNPRDTFLRKVLSLRPDVITCGNMEADFNMPFFLKRFELCLDLYGKLFQSFELGAPRTSYPRRIFEERIISRGLTNLVACEGVLLHVRPEGVAKLRKRMRAVGLDPRPQTPHAAEALRSMLLKYPPGFSIRPCCKGGGNVLSWDGADLASYAAWQPAREELD